MIEQELNMVRAALISLFAGLLSWPALAGEDAEQVIAETAIALQEGAPAETILSMAFDTDAIARFALGRHVRDLSQDDVDRFQSAFEAFLMETVSSQSDQLSHATVEIVGSTDRSARDSIVTTRVSWPGAEPETLRWRVIQRGGDWKIVDVQAYGLWLAIEQRAQIAAILDRSNGSIEPAIAQFDTELQEYAETEQDSRG